MKKAILVFLAVGLLAGSFSFAQDELGMTQHRPYHHRYRRFPHIYYDEGPHCMIARDGSKVCGYNCVRTAMGKVVCAPNKDQVCMVSEYGENVACGYQCAANGYDVKCTQLPNGSCVKSSMGVKCGINCHADWVGNITCDQEG